MQERGWHRRSNEELADKVGESREQIRRFIRLTELVPEILQMVDERQIAFRPAVEISYLSEEQQYTLLEAMGYNCSRLSPTLSASSSLDLDFDTSGVEVKSTRCPCLSIASSRIL